MFPSPWDKPVPCTPDELVRVRDRLRRALDEDLAAVETAPVASLTAAWTRISELRLPGWCLPTPIRDEVDELILIWDRIPGSGGIARAVYALSGEQVQGEVRRIARMAEIAELAYARALAQSG